MKLHFSLSRWFTQNHGNMTNLCHLYFLFCNILMVCSERHLLFMSRFTVFGFFFISRQWCEVKWDTKVTTAGALNTVDTPHLVLAMEMGQINSLRGVKRSELGHSYRHEKVDMGRIRLLCERSLMHTKPAKYCRLSSASCWGDFFPQSGQESHLNLIGRLIKLNRGKSYKEMLGLHRKWNWNRRSFSWRTGMSKVWPGGHLWSLDWFFRDPKLNSQLLTAS